MANKTVLVHPDGREYSTTDRTEITDLISRGYKVKRATKQDKPANKAAQPASK